MTFTQGADIQAVPHTRRTPNVRQPALDLLASCRDGCPEALMIAHGFTARQLAALVRDGLATATSERMLAGKIAMAVTRLRNTQAGRRAMGEQGG